MPRRHEPIVEFNLAFWIYTEFENDAWTAYVSELGIRANSDSPDSAINMVKDEIRNRLITLLETKD